MAECGEGDFFGVPLDAGGFAIGVIARANPKGALLGYFFGPRRDAVPELADAIHLRPSDAVYIARFGDLGLHNGDWPILGRTPGWDRAAWPMPQFARREELTGRTLEVTYADDDPARFVHERPITADEAETLPEDGLAGWKFVELRLARLLG